MLCLCRCQDAAEAGYVKHADGWCIGQLRWGWAHAPWWRQQRAAAAEPPPVLLHAWCGRACLPRLSVVDRVMIAWRFAFLVYTTRRKNDTQSKRPNERDEHGELHSDKNQCKRDVFICLQRWKTPLGFQRQRKPRGPASKVGIGPQARGRLFWTPRSTGESTPHVPDRIPKTHQQSQICCYTTQLVLLWARLSMSVLQHIVQHAQLGSGGLIPALGAVQQQWRSMSLYENPDWKYHFKYGINAERGACGCVWVLGKRGLSCSMQPPMPSTDLCMTPAAAHCCRQEGARPHFPQAAPGRRSK